MYNDLQYGAFPPTKPREAEPSFQRLKLLMLGSLKSLSFLRTLAERANATTHLDVEHSIDHEADVVLGDG